MGVFAWNKHVQSVNAQHMHVQICVHAMYAYIMCVHRIGWCVYIGYMFAEGVYVCAWILCVHDVWMFIGYMFMEFTCTCVCMWGAFAWDMCIQGICIYVYGVCIWNVSTWDAYAWSKHVQDMMCGCMCAWVCIHGLYYTYKRYVYTHGMCSCLHGTCICIG